MVSHVRPSYAPMATRKPRDAHASATTSRRSEGLPDAPATTPAHVHSASPGPRPQGAIPEPIMRWSADVPASQPLAGEGGTAQARTATLTHALACRRSHVSLLCPSVTKTRSTLTGAPKDIVLAAGLPTADSEHITHRRCRGPRCLEHGVVYFLLPTKS